MGNSTTIEHSESADAALTPAVQRRVYFVESRPQIRQAFTAILGEAGFTTVMCSDCGDVIRRAKEQTPDVVLLDVGAPLSEAEQCIRSLGRCYQTTSTVVLITCRSGFDPHHLAALIGAGAFAPIFPPLSALNILETVRAAAAESDVRKASAISLSSRAASPTRRVAGNNSLLMRPITCPFHNKPVTLKRFILRGRRIETDSSFFDVPIYRAATKGADFVNFHLLSVMVCPKCFFASSNPAYFTDPGEKNHEPHEHDAATRRAIISATDERTQMSSGASPDFFTYRRPIADALIALNLAVHCSQKLYGCSRGSLPNELLRRGNYHLRMAHLLELSGVPAEQVQAQCVAAFKPLQDAFTFVNDQPLDKATYQLVAIAIASGEDKIAYQYIKRLSELERETTGESKAGLQRYLSRCQKIWEDREDHRWAESPK